MWTDQTTTPWTPSSDSEKAAVWEQVERILRDPFFNKSRRYPSLLRFVVARTLDGHADSLKERILGIEVFGRKPDYDSTQDPIVRVTAAEIRKRILRYYSEPAHSNELRMVLPVGSYAIQFECLSLPDGTSEDAEIQPVPLEAFDATDSLAAPILDESPGRLLLRPFLLLSRRRRAIPVLAASGLLLITVIAVMYVTHKQDPFDVFWSPFLRAKSPILICLGDQPTDGITLMSAYSPDVASDHMSRPTFESGQSSFTRSVNLIAVLNLARILLAHGRTYKVQPQSTTTLSDLSTGPTVLLCAFNNYWTLKMTAPLRYHFGNDPALKVFWIEDRQSPNRRNWLLDASTELKSGKDYAIIAKFVPPDTRQPTVVIAGLGYPANIEGLKFLLSPRRMSELDHFAPPGWRDRNIEIVLETEVINGNAGPASIAAVYTW